MTTTTYPASRSRASDHWPTESEWLDVEMTVQLGVQALEEFMFRLKHTFKEETAPTPTLEDLGLIAVFARYLGSDVREIADDVEQLEALLAELDDIRINVNVEQSLGELGADDAA
jgi:hypothetical protein